MEEQGVPRRNIVIAAALAVAVYAVWYTFLLPKPAPRALEEHPTETVLATSAKSAFRPMPQLAPVEQPQAADFKLSSVEGTVLVHEGGAIKTLRPIVEASDRNGRLIIEDGRFFGTTSDLQGGDPWTLLPAQGDHLVVERASPNGTLRKEMIFSAQKPGFGILRFSFESKQPRTLVNLNVDLDAHLPYTKDKPAVAFTGYKGSKSLIVRFLNKKQTQVDETIEEKYPLAGLGLSSRYHLALVHGFDALPNVKIGERAGKDAPWSFSIRLLPGESVEIPFYLGLKRDQSLRDLGVENMLYGGLLGPLKKLVKWTLGAFYKVTGNYGFAIILLTLAFQVVLLPFTLKNLKFSQKMKELSPKIKVLQEKYKNDPQKMNAEMMQLYKSYGTNPLGGCLTMLLQMPIFFALYGALNDSYELYDAPFILWIKNLAAQDPTYILPVLMGGAMFLQTMKSQGTIADPSQKMMMYVMPVMFTFMFFKFPSGLVLYWLTSNVVSLGLTTILPKYMDKIT
ncbi:MAG: membrane protein insertase YidC [Elusimicrobia bacterium]|nr:membrane protein insertase YidC [Elusimicrobiota bacterium]